MNEEEILLDNLLKIINGIDWKKIINYVKNLQHQLEEKDKIIDEAMEYFIEDCPYSVAFKNEEEYKKVQKLCNCENCQDDYKKCWLKYLENEILERGKNEK